MSRGKPGADQLDLSLPMLDVLKSDSDMKSESGLDVRNYACLDGIPEAKALIAGMVGAKPEQAIVYGNSSLNIMYDQVSRAFIFGLWELQPERNVRYHCTFLFPRSNGKYTMVQA